jgi:hypothetical protein
MPAYRARLIEGRRFTTALPALDIRWLPRPLPASLPIAVTRTAQPLGGRRSGGGAPPASAGHGSSTRIARGGGAAGAPTCNLRPRTRTERRAPAPGREPSARVSGTEPACSTPACRRSHPGCGGQPTERSSRSCGRRSSRAGDCRTGRSWDRSSIACGTRGKRVSPPAERGIIPVFVHGVSWFLRHPPAPRGFSCACLLCWKRGNRPLKRASKAAERREVGGGS